MTRTDPAAGGSSEHATMIGRGMELGELRGALEAARRGRGALYLLSGEPGIGKTRLADELAASVAPGQMRVLWGRCHEAEGRPPYWPWAQVIQSCARDGDAAELAAALLPDAHALAELVPELRPHAAAPATASSADPDTARFRLFQVLAGCLARIAARVPLLVILDDLHWADLPSLHMLEFLAHELPERPMMVLGTLREAEVRRTADAAAAFDRLGRHSRPLPLAGFTRDEVSRFVEDAAGERVSEAIAEQLHHASGGNPFFLDEIVRQARGSGDWSASAARSHGVRSAIRQRLAPLPESTRDLLAAAAVAGRDFDLPLLAAALDVPRDALLERLAPAMENGIVAAIAGRAGRYRFTHALIRETIYEQVRPSHSVALHRRLGEVLESRYEAVGEAHLPELAHHFFAAAAGGAEVKALDYVERAGRHSLRVLAYEDAAEHFRRALDLCELGSAPDPARECELLLDLAEAQHRAGANDDAMKACRRAAAVARRIGSSTLLARAAIGMCEAGVAWAEFGRCDEALVSILDEALAQLAPEDAALRAPVMARIATEQFWTKPLAEVDAVSAQAVALARRGGDARALAYALMSRIHCISAPEAYAERRRLIDEVIALSGGAGKLAINAYLWRFGDELQFGDRVGAQASGENLVRAVQDLRQPRDMWLIPAVRSRQALLLGQLADAERLAEELIEHAAGVANAEHAYMAFLFMIRREQGRHGEMLDGLAAIATSSVVAVWHAPLALLHAETGDPAQAHAVLETLTRDGMQAVRRDLTWLFSVACLAAACHASASRAHAATLYDALAPYDGYTVVEGVFCYFGPVAYYLGMLASTAGRHDTAARHLDAALAAARALGARPFVARILLAQAQAIEAAGGDATRAASLRREALELAESIGMHGVADLARRPVADAAPVGASKPGRAGLRRDGDVWVVSFEGRSARVKAIKGVVYLRRLLAEPGREFNVVEMTRHADSADVDDAPRAGDGGLGAVLDPRAKREVRERLDDLREALAEAEASNDPERAARARAEIEFLADTMAGAVGLGGRDREQGAASERARAAVTKALRAAIDRIARFEPALGEVLSRTIRTGVFCAYEPIAQMPIVWELDPADDA